MNHVLSFFSESALARRVAFFVLLVLGGVAFTSLPDPWRWIAVGVLGLLAGGLGLSASERRCGNCRAFDLAAGQKQMTRFPAFPSAVLSPDQMARAGTPAADDGSGLPSAEPTPETAEVLDGRLHGWDQYGICATHRELRNCWDCCEQHRRK